MSKKQNKVEETEVRVVPYDPNWPVLFAEEAYSVRNAISDIVSAIEHFGSTSVPGLDANTYINLGITQFEANSTD